MRKHRAGRLRLQTLVAPVSAANCRAGALDALLNPAGYLTRFARLPAAVGLIWRPDRPLLASGTLALQRHNRSSGLKEWDHPHFHRRFVMN